MKNVFLDIGLLLSYVALITVIVAGIAFFVLGL